MSEWVQEWLSFFFIKIERKLQKLEYRLWFEKKNRSQMMHEEVERTKILT